MKQNHRRNIRGLVIYCLMVILIIGCQKSVNDSEKKNIDQSVVKVTETKVQANSKISENIENDKERHVISMNGVYLRENPSLESKKTAHVPFKEKVTILEENKQEVVVDKMKGYWLKVLWKNNLGWAFDGFLKRKDSSKFPIYHLYNIVNYDESKLNGIIKSYFSNIKEGIDYPISLTMFVEIPEILPKDEMIIITKNKIIEDKVKSLNIDCDPVTGCLLMFDLEKYPVNSGRPCALYIQKSQLFKNETPILNGLKLINNPKLLEGYLYKIMDNFDLNEYGFKKNGMVNLYYL